MILSINRPLLVITLTLAIGLGIALALPWLANTQSQAASMVHDLGADNAPGASARYHVAKSGDGSDGLTWTTAFTSPLDALGIALSGDEIWVASGVYTPGNSIYDSFVLVNGAEMYGGFGGNEGLKSERDWEVNLTILSGDIQGDDTSLNGVVRDASYLFGDNSYHVISATNVAKNTILDGFTITAGQAGGSSPDDSGGGFYCDGYGTGNKCSPTLNNIIFSGNLADGYGGAMYNDGRQWGVSNPYLFNVLFTGNSAFDGGAVYNEGSNKGESSPDMKNVSFMGNSAKNGGALFNYGTKGISSPIIINGLFSGNKAVYDGGALYNSGFSGISRPVLTNVTISGNRAEKGGGVFSNNSRENVRNSILWSNLDETGLGTISSTVFNNNALITVTHSLVQGADVSGSGIWVSNPGFIDSGSNIDQDPLFVLPADPSTSPTTAGDLRLQENSPAIDMGNNEFVEEVDSDLDSGLRLFDGNLDGGITVDMGAYEYQIPYKYDGYLPFVFH